jgi:hypothetical protein
MSLVSKLEILVLSEKPISDTLERGLLLAYTPATEDGECHRLTMSRKGDKHPSRNEIDIVVRDLKKTLSRLERPYGDLCTEEGLRNKSYSYHVIKWREWRQATLFPVQKQVPYE